MIIRAVGFTVKIVVRGFVTFIFMRKNKNKAVTLRSIVFKYPGFTACCWLSVGWGISGTSIRFMGFNSLYGYDYILRSKRYRVIGMIAKYLGYSISNHVAFHKYILNVKDH